MRSLLSVFLFLYMYFCTHILYMYFCAVCEPRVCKCKWMRSLLSLYVFLYMYFCIGISEYVFCIFISVFVFLHSYFCICISVCISILTFLYMYFCICISVLFVNHTTVITINTQAFNSTNKQTAVIGNRLLCLKTSFLTFCFNFLLQLLDYLN